MSSSSSSASSVGCLLVRVIKLSHCSLPRLGWPPIELLKFNLTRPQLSQSSARLRRRRRVRICRPSGGQLLMGSN